MKPPNDGQFWNMDFPKRKPLSRARTPVGMTDKEFYKCEAKNILSRPERGHRYGAATQEFTLSIAVVDEDDCPRIEQFDFQRTTMAYGILDLSVLVNMELELAVSGKMVFEFIEEDDGKQTIQPIYGVHRIVLSGLIP